MPAPIGVGPQFIIEEKTDNVRPELSRMAALPDGGFVAVWNEEGELHLRIFGSNGIPRAAEVRASYDYENAPRFGAGVTVLTDGGYVATWISPEGAVSHIMAVVFNADGSVRKGPFNVSEKSYGWLPSLSITALANGGFTVAHTGIGTPLGDPQIAVLGRTFNASGDPASSTFLINGTTEGDQSRPAIAQLKNGTIAAAYLNGSDVSVRLMAADGTSIPNTSEIMVGRTNNDLEPFTIAALSHDRFVVVWAASSGDGSGSAIMAQVFAANGNRIGDQITVNTTATGNQTTPKVSALPDGGFAVVFEDYGLRSGDIDVRLATFDAAGNRYHSSDLLVHTSTAGSHLVPGIITLADGHLAVSWRDADGSLVGRVFQQDLVVNGTAGADVLRGGPGSDVMNGLDDFDRLYGSAGADHLSGGDGFDVADYSNAKAAVVIDLTNLSNNDGEAKGDTYDSIEAWIGSAFNDTITADTAQELWADRGNDVITAGSGSTYLDGGSGNDTLEGGAGGDVLIGGDGFDIVSYASSTDRVTVSLKGNGSATGGDATGDTFVSNGNPSNSVEGIIGSRFADTLTGHLTIGSYLNGGEAADELHGGSGDDTLIGGIGDDRLQGGGGNDTAVFSGSRSQYTIERSVDGTVRVNYLDEETDLLTGIRFLQFRSQDKIEVEVLTNAAPTGLTLSNAVTVENAPLGAEVGRLAATDADGDTIRYSLAPGSSTAFGIRGNSLVVTGPLDFETQPTHQVTIQAKDDYGGLTSLTVNLTVTNAIETTPFTIRGTSRAETLTGENGHDTIYGSSGHDRLYGGLGNDRLHGGNGNDRLYGQGGKDVFVFDTKAHKSTNVDKIYDFKSRDDSFYLDNKYFTKLGSGSLSKPKKFKSDVFTEGKKAKDAEDRIVYDKKTGALYYDQDGTGSKAQVKIATISNKTKLYWHDFFVI